MIRMLACDLGASSGKVICGELDNEKLFLEEIHRFSNDPVIFLNHIHWDILRLIYEVKQGLLKADKAFPGDISSIGVDTWGVDYGLLGKSGELLDNPYHYRDARTKGMVEKFSKLMMKEKLFHITGLQTAVFNTLYQLLAAKTLENDTLERSKALLLMPDLINYALTGVMVSEYTNVTTTQLYNFDEDDWDDTILKKIGIPKYLFGKVVKPGYVVGNIRENVCKELNISPIKVISVASHDTASAVASIPCKNENTAFISTGTWLLVGTEIDKPIISDLVQKYNFTNEGGVSNKINLIKNVVGLWLIQECKRSWEKKGICIGFPELNEMARREKGFISFVDPDDPVFFSQGDMPEKIKEYCKRTNQYIPQSIGQIIRCIEESLAFRCRWAIEKIEEVTSKKIGIIHMVGGGIRDELLCQLIANALGRKVIAGPVEATSIGNIIIQALALGEIRNIEQGREIVENSFETKEFSPEIFEEWNKNYDRFINLINRNNDC